MASTAKRYTNDQVAQHLTDIATAYEIKKKSRFRITAYQNAADTVQNYPKDLYFLWTKDPQLLDSIPNIGPAIQKKISYLFAHHQPYPSLKTIFANIHPAVFTFTKINGIGPLIAHKLTRYLKFPRQPELALEKLIEHTQKGKLRKLAGFGEKSEKVILDNTLSFLGRKDRLPLATAQTMANKIILYLQTKFPKTTFIPLGSLRRQNPSVGDIDIAVASQNATEIIDYFVDYPGSTQTISRGENEASIRLLHDIHVDLMVKPPKGFGALLQHFTGSRQHNILLRRHAIQMGYSLSEYGIKNTKTGQLHQFDTEKDFYHFLGFKLIPPQERVGEDELEKYKI